MLHRHARPAVAGAFLFGATLGALVTTSGVVIVAGLLSAAPAVPRAALAVAIAAAASLRAIGLISVALPQRARQIPREVFRDDPRRAAWRFSFELGTGLRTYVTSSAPYALVGVLALAPTPGLVGVWYSLLAGAAFGLGRALIVATHAASRRIAVEHPEPWLRLASLVSIAASGAIGTTLLAS